MALNRAWYNALVDDDGTNTVGTVWGKDDIKNLLDSVDAEIARMDSRFSSGQMYPGLASTGGGTPTYAVAAGRFQRAENAVIVGGKLVLSSKGSLATGLVHLTGLPFTSNAATRQGGLLISYFGSLAINVAGMGSIVEAGAAHAYLTFVPAAGATGQQFLDPAHITGTFEIEFGGVYLI